MRTGPIRRIILPISVVRISCCTIIHRISFRTNVTFSNVVTSSAFSAQKAPSGIQPFRPRRRRISGINPEIELFHSESTAPGTTGIRPQTHDTRRHEATARRGKRTDFDTSFASTEVYLLISHHVSGASFPASKTCRHRVVFQ